MYPHPVKNLMDFDPAKLPDTYNNWSRTCDRLKPYKCIDDHSGELRAWIDKLKLVHPEVRFAFGDIVLASFTSVTTNCVDICAGSTTRLLAKIATADSGDTHDLLPEYIWELHNNRITRVRVHRTTNYSDISISTLTSANLTSPANFTYEQLYSLVKGVILMEASTIHGIPPSVFRAYAQQGFTTMTQLDPSSPDDVYHSLDIIHKQVGAFSNRIITTVEGGSEISTPGPNVTFTQRQSDVKARNSKEAIFLCMESSQPFFGYVPRPLFDDFLNNIQTSNFTEIVPPKTLTHLVVMLRYKEKQIDRVLDGIEQGLAMKTMFRLHVSHSSFYVRIRFDQIYVADYSTAKPVIMRLLRHYFGKDFVNAFVDSTIYRANSRILFPVGEHHYLGLPVASYQEIAAAPMPGDVTGDKLLRLLTNSSTVEGVVERIQIPE